MFGGATPMVKAIKRVVEYLTAQWKAFVETIAFAPAEPARVRVIARRDR